MIRFLIIGVVIYVFYRAFKNWMLKNTPEIRRPGSGKAMGAIDDVMVKDPFCEVYFPKREGVTARVNGEELHFCSARCRDKYLAERSNDQS